MSGISSTLNSSSHLRASDGGDDPLFRKRAAQITFLGIATILFIGAAIASFVVAPYLMPLGVILTATAVLAGGSAAYMKIHPQERQTTHPGVDPNKMVSFTDQEAKRVEQRGNLERKTEDMKQMSRDGQSVLPQEIPTVVDCESSDCSPHLSTFLLQSWPPDEEALRLPVIQRAIDGSKPPGALTAYNVATYEHTVACMNRYLNGAPQKRSLDALCPIRKMSRKDIQDAREIRHQNTLVYVFEADALTHAKECFLSGEKVAVLDMANGFTPAGSVATGGCNQEERLAHATFLGPLLRNAQEKGYYPLNDSARKDDPSRCVYISNVPVIKEVDSNVTDAIQYKYLEQPFHVSIGAVAATNANKKKECKLYQSAEEQTAFQERVRLFLQAAYDEGQDAAILGALGCGAFAPQQSQEAEMHRKRAASLMMEVIAEFRGCFKRIVIAIAPVANDLNPNHAIFEQALMVQGGKSIEKVVVGMGSISFLWNLAAARSEGGASEAVG